MRSLFVLALLLPAPALAQSPADALHSLAVGMRPTATGVRGASRGDAVAALGAAGASLDCDSLTWLSDEAGVETAQCTGTMSLHGHPAMVVLDFVRYRLPGVPPREGLDRVSVSSHRDTGFRAWLERDLTRRLGSPDATNGRDRRWHPRDRWVVLDDPSNQPCGGLCVPTLWILGEGSPVLSRFPFP